MSDVQPIAGRTPPYSAQAEDATLGCLFIDGSETLNAAAELGITPESFYQPSARIIWKAAVALNETGKPVDVMVVAEELRRTGLLESVGGIQYLSEIQDNIPTTAHRKYFLEQVRTLHAQRQLISSATKAIEAAYQFNGRPDDLVSEVNGIMASLMTRSGEMGWQGSIDAAEKIANARIAGGETEMDGRFRLGLPGFDRRAGKPSRGDLVVVAARPSVGKSSLVGQGTLATVSLGYPVAVFNLETSGPDYVARMAAVRSEVNPRGLAYELPMRQRAYLKALKDLKSITDLHVFRNHRSFGQITSRIRQLHSQKPLEAVVIDHLALIETPQSLARETRERQIAWISSQLKGLAGELMIPIILVCQLNRASEKEDRPPRMSDLRESGALEQDADKVWLMHRPSVDVNGESQEAKPGEVRTIVHQILEQAKDRNGDVFAVPVQFNRTITKFTEIEKRP